MRKLVHFKRVGIVKYFLEQLECEVFYFTLNRMFKLYERIRLIEEVYGQLRGWPKSFVEEVDRLAVGVRNRMNGCSSNLNKYDAYHRWQRYSRIMYLHSSPGIHDDPNVSNGLIHSSPPFFAWRGDIYHIKLCSRCEEMRRSALLAVIGIHKGPNKNPEIGRREFGRSYEDAIF
jgi:hypothetical protein